MRPATIEEMTAAIRWVQQQVAREKVLTFAAAYYGERAEKVVVIQTQHWNDDGYTEQVHYIEVYDSTGYRIEPDYGLPAWEVTKEQVMEAFGWETEDEDAPEAAAADAWLKDNVYGRYAAQQWDVIIPFPAAGDDSSECDDLVLTYYVSDPNKGAPLTCFVYPPLNEVRSADLETQ